MNFSLPLALLSFYKCGKNDKIQGFERCGQSWIELEDKFIWVSRDEATFEKAKIKCKTWNSVLFEPRNVVETKQVFDLASCGLYFIGTKHESEEGM